MQRDIRLKIYSLTNDLRGKYQKRINNVYIWSSLARDAISAAMKNENFLSKNEVLVPTKKGKKEKLIRRKKEDLAKILLSARKEDFNYSIHAYLVAQVEAFISDLIRGVLRIDQRRLKIRVQGINHVNKVDVNTIINSNSLEEIKEELIDQEMIGISYASPKKQFEYLKRVIGVNNNSRVEEVFMKWREWKAIRDLILHNNGVVNNYFLSKVDNKSYANLGSKISITDKDIDSVVADSKALIGRITTSIKRKEGGKSAV